MNNFKLLTACFALLAGLAPAAFCATNGVVLGQDFQSVINASAPGDTLIVQPGVYPDASLVFNKPLTVLPSGTNGSPIQFLGTIQVTGAGTNSFQRAYFVSSVQTVGSTVSFFDSRFDAAVSATGGKLTMKRTSLNYPLTLSSNAALEALRMTNNASVSAIATTGSGTSFLAVQSVFIQRLAINGYKAWFGYNSFPGGTLQQTNCDSVLIGNKFTGNAGAIDKAALYSEGGTFKAYNNLMSGSYGPPVWEIYGMWLRSNVAEIVNNTISITFWDGPAGGAHDSRGIYASEGTGPITLRANVINVVTTLNGSGGGPIEAAGGKGQFVFLSYCDFMSSYNGAYPGITNLVGIVPPPLNCLLQVNPNLAADGSPSTNSPCLNAGPPDAIYNNRDGTRNTMGYTGGPYWNPANYTNNNPMVFLLTGQQVVLNGAQTNLQVNVGASAGH